VQLGSDSGHEAEDLDILPQSALSADSDGEPQGFLNADSRANNTVGGKTSFTIDQAANRLIGGEAGWGGILGAAFNVSYAYRSVAPATMPKDVSEFQRFNAAQINQAELALKAWADVANITFTRVGAGSGSEEAYSNQASILFSNYTSGLSGASAFSAYPGNPSFNSSAGDVWVNVSLSNNANPTPDNYGGQTLLHEIGHAIGLSHPSDYNAASGETAPVTYAGDADYYEDSRQYTVMSYFNESNTGGSFRGVYASSPLLDDIAAAQMEYGANMRTRIGDTVYGFNSNADQPWLKVASANTPMVTAVWDAGGEDTFDFSGYASNQVIDLRAGFFSSVGGLTGNVAVAQGAQIENAVGGIGADVIHGNAGDNKLFGGAGADTIDGGSGGSNYLRGEDGNDSLVGGADFDDINGNRGNDVARGGGGRDWVVGGQDQDLLYGDDGDDVVYGNLGNDTVFGGDGKDWVRGGQGDDVVDGGAGDDLLWGDRGNDTVSGGAGADMFHIFVGAGTDRVTDFNGAEGDRAVVDDGASWTVSQSADGVVITLLDGSTMVLAGLASSSLQAGWILAA
jgi:serralysin